MSDKPDLSPFINNPSQRTPCVLVLDASGSMETPTAKGTRRIDELNVGIRTLEQELKNDPVAGHRVQIGIVSVGGPGGRADKMMDWTDAGDFQAFDLSCGGSTPLATLASREEGIRYRQHAAAQTLKVWIGGPKRRRDVAPGGSLPPLAGSSACQPVRRRSVWAHGRLSQTCTRDPVRDQPRTSGPVTSTSLTASGTSHSTRLMGRPAAAEARLRQAARLRGCARPPCSRSHRLAQRR